jgi:hypothetical protein
MGSSCFIGTECSEPSGAKQIEDWVTEISRQVDNGLRKNGQPRWWIVGIDYGFDNGPKRIPVVIGK